MWSRRWIRSKEMGCRGGVLEGGGASMDSIDWSALLWSDFLDLGTDFNQSVHLITFSVETN